MERQHMWGTRHLPVAATLLAIVAFALIGGRAGAAEAEHASYTAPRSGSQYTGTTAQRKRLTLTISRRTVQIVGFSFNCRSVVGRTSVQDIRIRRTSRGYVFSVTAYGIVSFSDERPDQNAKVTINGRFSRSARTVAGRLRVDAPRCDTPSLTWSARR